MALPRSTQLAPRRRRPLLMVMSRSKNYTFEKRAHPRIKPCASCLVASRLSGASPTTPSSLRGDVSKTMTDHLWSRAQFSSATRLASRLALERGTSYGKRRFSAKEHNREAHAPPCAQITVRCGAMSARHVRRPLAPQPPRSAPLASAVAKDSRRCKSGESGGYRETVSLGTETGELWPRAGMPGRLGEKTGK